MSNPYRIAHLSDLHFSKVEFNFKQFFNKRWIGNLNYLLRRQKDFNYSILSSLPILLQKEKVDLVLLSGDLSCTASHAEFALASHFINLLKQSGLQVVLVPGNHDSYTKNAYKKKRFYEFFPSKYDSSFDLKEHNVALKHLSEKWWLLLLDTTLATPLLCCHGRFSEKAEKHLKEALLSLPPDANVILANHFPIDCKKLRPALQRRSVLFNLFKEHPNIRLYLHGHNHRHTILDLRKENLPITSDAGSASHQTHGTWTLMECKENHCSFQPFHWNMEKESWISCPTLTSFNW